MFRATKDLTLPTTITGSLPDVLTFECATTDGMDLEAIGRTIQDPPHRLLQDGVDRARDQPRAAELGLPEAECRAADARFALVDEGS